MRSSQPHKNIECEKLLDQAEALCRDLFGYPSLRKHQKTVLEKVFSGQDCLAVLPTGGGKSLCYALPAMLLDGLTVVVSPLIALIRDQLRRFSALGLPVAAFDSLQSGYEKDSVWQDISQGKVRLLFLSPERLARVDVREKLQRLTIPLIAIDEAHCVSSWGNHFRPDYRMLGDYFDALSHPGVQKLALTATATPKVRNEIEERLKLQRPALVIEDFVRDNLELRVIKVQKVQDQFTSLLNGVLSIKGAGIIYAPTRKLVSDVQRMLGAAKIESRAYHAGLSPEERALTQKLFASGQIRVVVATNAFGMGIDKGDIRFVHHMGMPGSIEQYVQEIGRAGRDGQHAKCWLIYGSRDYHIQKFMIDKSFPTSDSLEKALEQALELTKHGSLASEKMLTRRIAQSMGQDEGVARRILDLFCREGLLSALRCGSGIDPSEILISEGSLSEADRFFAEYPLRKEEYLAKLDAMRAYAGDNHNRKQLIEDYFR